ncbi:MULTISPECIES: tripartite tricarboxylate transporter substrate binding protein [unclassified Polynucleobacter]|mgnify:FL=1|jgi:tripartite-type tricarboxylate transporter receptor subunit TctC|uniref:Bug family tripartite tricarboxylate transporter substrate binding protein n=1 Tax=unclassified Polynucleobacter TaxID=2640945 RepID=UPI001C0DD810|nr:MULTISPECIES: tripartite tricarboxylate transporter substrate binding protein [unclassified Polynucleobacter]MBU3588317.1 tripartite tricarboxylate transporter substrate binding protein [Polynucleobacter sp. 31A-FELB]
MNRRFTLKFLSSLVAGGIVSPMHVFGQSAYPNKAIKMIVPFPAGGPTDIVARPLAKLMGDQLGQQVFIDNKGGAGGSVGVVAVASSPPDGYTLLMGTVGTSAINPHLYKSLAYDPINSLTPIATVASAPVAVVVNPSSGITSLADLIAKAKANPDQYTYGTAGNGAPGHLTGAMFCAATDIKLRHIAYKGSAPAVTDLLGGQIDIMFDPLQSVLPHIKSGKLRVLGVTSASRTKVLPDVPTVSELVPNFTMTAWWAVYGPAGMPKDVVAKLKAAISKSIASPEFDANLSALGVQPLETPLADLQKKELAKWGAAVRSAGITME